MLNTSKFTNTRHFEKKLKQKVPTKKGNEADPLHVTLREKYFFKLPNFEPVGPPRKVPRCHHEKWAFLEEKLL